MLKAKAHIATGQYEFIEVELEGESNEDIKMAYNAIKRVWEGAEGLPQRDFTAFLDRQLMGEGGNHIDQYEAMNEIQKVVVQEIKKALKRLKAREQ